jgi:hypothetical protein
LTQIYLLINHIFFINKITYSNEKGSLSFLLKKNESFSFSIAHLKYETMQVVFERGITLGIKYLKERQEMLKGIEIYSERNLKAAFDFKKLWLSSKINMCYLSKKENI